MALAEMRRRVGLGRWKQGEQHPSVSVHGEARQQARTAPSLHSESQRLRPMGHRKGSTGTSTGNLVATWLFSDPHPY